MHCLQRHARGNALCNATARLSIYPVTGCLDCRRAICLSLSMHTSACVVSVPLALSLSETQICHCHAQLRVELCARVHARAFCTYVRELACFVTYLTPSYAAPSRSSRGSGTLHTRTAGAEAASARKREEGICAGARGESARVCDWVRQLK